METISQAQERIIADFCMFEDPFDRYAYLIEIAGSFIPMEASLKTEAAKVQGCQSNAWLDVSCDDEGRFFFQADSDTFIIKGVLKLLQDVLCGRTCDEVANAALFFIKAAGIDDTFDDARQKGIGYIVARLQSEASQAARLQ